MKRISSHFPQRLALGAAAVLAAAAFAACGSDSEEEPQKLDFQVNVSGNTTAVTVPEKAETGLAEITYGNNSQGEADLQLIRVEGEHTAKEVVDGLITATEGKPFPDWFFAAGGVGLIGPGEIVTTKQVLQPGTYYAFNTESRLTPKTASAIEVWASRPTPSSRGARPPSKPPSTCSSQRAPCRPGATRSSSRTPARSPITCWPRS